MNNSFSTFSPYHSTLGFGAEAEHDKGGADHLKEVEVGYVSNIDCVADCSTCDGYNSGEITENMMCASGPGKDACHGDSGGPLFDKGKNVVVGIVSFGNGCAQSAYPGVYSRISSQVSE
jgi:secreted trypsin-like serine protease